MREIGGKAAVVTGGASGIGLGIAAALIEEGARVAILDRNPRHLAEARERFAGSNAAMFVESDVAERERLRTGIDKVVAAFGGVDILCNNAGIGGGGAVDDPSFDDWDRCLRINLGGVVNGVKIVAPMMKARGQGGHIVNTASMAGICALPDEGGCYTTGKFAVRGLTESLRLTLAPFGIGVSCLCPGLTRSRILDAQTDESGAGPTNMLDTLFASMEGAMEPIELGRMVVAGIRGNRPYILTHGEFRDEVADDMAQLLAAFPTGQEVPPARLSLEQSRRGLSDARKAMRID